jgi:hypothetical protein
MREGGVVSNRQWADVRNEDRSGERTCEFRLDDADEILDTDPKPGTLEVLLALLPRERAGSALPSDS